MKGNPSGSTQKSKVQKEDIETLLCPMYSLVHSHHCHSVDTFRVNSFSLPTKGVLKLSSSRERIPIRSELTTTSSKRTLQNTLNVHLEMY